MDETAASHSSGRSGCEYIVRLSQLLLVYPDARGESREGDKGGTEDIRGAHICRVQDYPKQLSDKGSGQSHSLSMQPRKRSSGCNCEESRTLSIRRNPALHLCTTSWGTSFSLHSARPWIDSNACYLQSLGSPRAKEWR